MSAPGSAGAAITAPAALRIRAVAILGAGAEGSWLAVRAAHAGYHVTLEDLMPGKRREAARRIAEQAGSQAAVAFAGSVEEAARAADLVIDFVPDELESKLEILSLLDRMAPPHTIFAVPTRALSIADLASCTYRAERCVGLRLPTLPLAANAAFRVEVVHAPGAIPEVVSAVAAFWASLGAQVVVLVDSAPLP